MVEEGRFFNSILSILERKVKEGVEVRFMYDDIGCIALLPRDFAERLLFYKFQQIFGNCTADLLALKHINNACKAFWGNQVDCLIIFDASFKQVTNKKRSTSACVI